MKNYFSIGKSVCILMVMVLMASKSFAGIGATTHFTTVWEGENGQDHMNFMVVSAIFEDVALLVNDEIAVFSGSKCVGATKLTSSINPADNTSFLKISASRDDGSNNGFIENDTIIFKIWDNLNQKEIVAKSVTYRNDISTWVATGKFSSGATSVVEIVSYNEFTQTVSFIRGNNMFSTYLTPKNQNAALVMKALCDGGYLSKMTDETGKAFSLTKNVGWVNNIGSMENTEGYLLSINSNCTFQLTGRMIKLPLAIPLKSGWNYISFPKTVSVNAMTIVQQLIDQNKLIKVQEEAGNSIENLKRLGGWKNGIGNFLPGKSYKVNVNADAILTIQ